MSFCSAQRRLILHFSGSFPHYQLGLSKRTHWQLSGSRGGGRITFLALFLALALSPMWFPTLVGSLCSDSGVYLIDLAPALYKRFITLFSCPTSRSSFLLLLISGLLSLPLFGFAMLPVALLTSSYMKFLLQNYPTFTLSLDWHWYIYQDWVNLLLIWPTFWNLVLGMGGFEGPKFKRKGYHRKLSLTFCMKFSLEAFTNP